MIRVLHITDSPIFGGAEKQMLNLIEGLEHYERIKCGLLCTQKDVLKYAHKILGTENVFCLSIRGKHDPRWIPAIWSVTCNFRPHLIHIHRWTPAGCRLPLIALLLKRTRSPIVVTEHDHFILSAFKQATISFLNIIVNNHIAISSETAKELNHLKNVTVVHNGVRETDFPVLPLQRSGIILVPSALHYRKGVDIAIRSFRLISDKYPDACLRIVGSGYEEKNLNSLIKNMNLQNRVKIVGWVDNIRAEFEKAQIVLLPSRREGFGLARIEAGCMGRPVVASRIGGYLDTVIDWEDGILCKVDCVDEFAKSLKLLLDDFELCRELGEYAAMNIREKFGVDKMVQKTNELYINTLNKK